MKTFIFSALALGMMASCANTDVEGVSTVDNGEPVAIQLSAGVQENVVVSRAPITGDVKFQPTILGWEAETTIDYTGTPWNASTLEEIASNASGVSITLNPVQYYNANEKIYTFMKAFYVSDATPKVEDNKDYVYTFTNTDGAKDVLLSDVISGNKMTNNALNFSFKHPLTQVSFKVVAGDGVANGTTLTSITLKNVVLPTGFDFSKEAPLTYTLPADLNVSGITSLAIAKNAVDAGSPVMIQPISDLKLDIVTSTGTFKDVPVVLKDKTTALSAGTAYTITLTFSQKAITGTASVTDWTSGEGGADVE